MAKGLGVEDLGVPSLLISWQGTVIFRVHTWDPNFGVPEIKCKISCHIPASLCLYWTVFMAFLGHHVVLHVMYAQRSLNQHPCIEKDRALEASVQALPLMPYAGEKPAHQPTNLLAWSRHIFGNRAGDWISEKINRNNGLIHNALGHSSWQQAVRPQDISRSTPSIHPGTSVEAKVAMTIPHRSGGFKFRLHFLCIF